MAHCLCAEGTNSWRQHRPAGRMSCSRVAAVPITSVPSLFLMGASDQQPLNRLRMSCNIHTVSSTHGPPDVQHEGSVAAAGQGKDLERHP